MAGLHQRAEAYQSTPTTTASSTQSSSTRQQDSREPVRESAHRTLNATARAATPLSCRPEAINRVQNDFQPALGVNI
jgi:hypothetical protein